MADDQGYAEPQEPQEPFDRQPPEQLERVEPGSPGFDAHAYYKGLADRYGHVPPEHFQR
jgi:hypothetical protein